MHISYNRMIVEWYKKTKSSVLHGEAGKLMDYLNLINQDEKQNRIKK